MVGAGKLSLTLPLSLTCHACCACRTWDSSWRSSWPRSRARWVGGAKKVSKACFQRLLALLRHTLPPPACCLWPPCWHTNASIFSCLSAGPWQHRTLEAAGWAETGGLQGAEPGCASGAAWAHHLPCNRRLPPSLQMEVAKERMAAVESLVARVSKRRAARKAGQ